MSKSFPHIPWFQLEVDTSEKKLVLEVLKSNYLNDGHVTRKFETKLAKFLKIKHCVGVTNGTSAMSLVLWGLGVGPGDEVIVPDLTFIATMNAVRMIGAEVRLVDVTLDRFTIDLEKVEKAITKRTRAIIPVDVNGRGADYDVLIPLAKKHGLFVVTDSCEALGSKCGGRFLGTFGDAGCFSFSPSKTVTTGQGGMIVTDNTKFYHRLLELKDQGRRKQGTGGDDLHPVIGYNFKLTNLQAAVGLGQLKKLKKRLRHFVKRNNWYREFLKGIPGIFLPKYEPGEVTQWMDILIEDRSRVEKAFQKRGIGFRNFWFPIHRQKPYADSDENFPNTCFISRCGLWLPSAFSLTQDQAERVSRIVKEAVG